MTKLFNQICDIVFTLEDNSQMLCKTTLNEGILSQHGWADLDAFVDLLSNRIIPDEMFENDFIILDENTASLSELDSMFIDGGKISWKQLS